jgi:hypothetical protein
MNISEELALRLMHNPLLLQQWTGADVCPMNTISMSKEDADKWVLQNMIHHGQYTYFTNLLNFDIALQTRAVQQYEYKIMNEFVVNESPDMDKNTKKKEFTGMLMTYPFRFSA